jgi:hypothetical protein
VWTIRLTTRAARDADRRRVLEALVTIRYAAEQLQREASGTPQRTVSSARFHDAQQELERARAMLLVVWSPNVDENIERLRNHDGDDDDPAQAISDATAAHILLTSQPPPPRMPRWYRRAITVPSRQAAKRIGG